MYSQAYAIRPEKALPCSQSGAALVAAGPRVLVIDAARRLIEATAGARDILADGTILRRRFEQVVAATSADAARLVAALSETLARGQARVMLGTGADTLRADLVTTHADSSGGGHIVMILKPAREERVRRLTEAETEFGLTRAEARLLAALFEGCSVPQAAARLGVARSTARTHLQRVFDKTGARRQGDLLRLVGCA